MFKPSMLRRKPSMRDRVLAHLPGVHRTSATDRVMDAMKAVRNRH